MQVYFRVYDFGKENSLWFYQTRNYDISFEHFVEGEKLKFKITKLINSEKRKDPLIPTIIEKMIYTVKNHEISTFIDGAVFCDQSSKITINNSEMSVKEQQVQPATKNNNRLVFLLIGFVLLLVCFFYYSFLFS